jgi:hypothetical protein
MLLLFLPFGEIFRFGLGDNIYLIPLDVISVLLLMWTTVLYIINKSYRKSLYWYYFSFPLVGLIALGINSYWLKPNELVTSFLYLFRWVAYMSIFFAVIRFDESFRKKVTVLLFIDGIVVLLIGYLQYFFYQNLKNLFYLGWDNHLYRMFSSFFDPNFVGAFFVLYFIFLIGLRYGIGRKIRMRLNVLYSILIVAVLVAIFLTYQA